MNNKLSLLEKAKKIATTSKAAKFYSDDEIELVLAFMEDEISLTQLTRAAGLESTGSGYSYIVSVLKQFFQDKRRVKKGK